MWEKHECPFKRFIQVVTAAETQLQMYKREASRVLPVLPGRQKTITHSCFRLRTVT